MAAGIPFVATNVGAVQDVATGARLPLPNGLGWQVANGFLTQRLPEALLHCLQQLFDNPELVRQMSAAGRKFALQRFSTERLITELVSLYQSLLQSKGIGHVTAVQTKASDLPA